MDEDDQDDGERPADVEHVVSLTTPIRLDVYASVVFGRSRSAIKHLIEAGMITLQGRATQASRLLLGGERLRIDTPPIVDTLEPEDLPLEVLWEDDDVMVLNKQAGLVVHPAAGQRSGTLCNALRFHRPTITTGSALRPGLVHRLDKDTSGTILIAKHDEALRLLAEAFAKRHVEKWYIAFTSTAPPAPCRWVTGHVRSGKDRRRFSTKLAAPAMDTVAVKKAVTDVVSMQACNHGFEVRLCLRTGRTHQIRAHLADAGTPIIGDGLYGGDTKALQRQALHAHRLVFPHPGTHRLMAVEAPLPADLAALRG
jgi:23S rRNA pseudouridine1911/1915/1917 synthase